MNWTRAKLAVDGPGQRLGEEGLAHAGEVLHDDVPAGQQGHHAGADDLFLAQDHRPDGTGDLAGAVGDLHHLLVLKDRRGDQAGICRTAGGANLHRGARALRGPLLSPAPRGAGSATRPSVYTAVG